MAILVTRSVGTAERVARAVRRRHWERQGLKDPGMRAVSSEELEAARFALNVAREEFHSEIDLMRSRILELENAITLKWQAPTQFNLSVTEERIVGILIKQNSAAKEVFSFVDNTLVKHIQRIRAKLAPFGIEIKTTHGYGYFIAPDMRDKIKNLMKSEISC